jgi:hypothetical protein
MQSHAPRQRPDTFIVGAPKCGTTALDHYLAHHPDVFVPADKDVRFFGRDLTVVSRLDEATFLQRYAQRAGQRRALDSSVYGLLSKTAAWEIKAFHPDARVIVMLRDPLEVIPAHHAQLQFNGLGEDEDLPLAEALAAEADRRAGRRLPPRTRVREALYYREVVDYAPQVARFFDALGPDRVHVIWFDAFKHDTAGAVREVLSFLGVDPDVSLPTPIVNPNTVTRSPWLRRALAATPASLKELLPTRARLAIRSRLRRANTKVAPRAPLDPTLAQQLAVELRPRVDALERLLDHPLPSWCRVSPP